MGFTLIAYANADFTDVTADMLQKCFPPLGTRLLSHANPVVKKVLCFVNQQGRLVTWLQTKDTARTFSVHISELRATV